MCSGLTAYGAMKKVPALGPKDDVLVVGAGGVGMMAIQFAKQMFGKGPLVADIDEGRLQAAMGAGAKAVYNTNDPEAAEEADGRHRGRRPGGRSISSARRPLRLRRRRRCGAAAG